MGSHTVSASINIILIAFKVTIFVIWGKKVEFFTYKSLYYFTYNNTFSFKIDIKVITRKPTLTAKCSLFKPLGYSH